ncbi:hypothetical protein BU24DRAFT_39004 [Aaosphaeria arxii CBS 175.79]|uniref:Zn(2)-C6 fungal-type domain-containing protein n=1 Tax=Aaosphaeria arxii CBS 175.79 TaxID=1450172 RepID=A0A6A5Y981_9PLEO|nr:uncharacterized protein BU24DRAFT_39004 [Aaosphaeria arxii CBS 175.79]KAF2022162.1 hypothetical protein BU24DRAFT_39004 [Aaosphaeria arxii CBS 175.79]
MGEQHERTEPTARKRALVSCDRCKTRRARCIRPSPDQPCSDCMNNGLQCESKLPRKQRVYGSVETLSLRFRALESLVKGLFPDENTQDTNTLFKIAASRNLSMPAANDYSPAEIFKGTKRHMPSLQTSTSDSSNSDAAYQPTAFPSRIPALDNTSSAQPVERLIPTSNGIPHYFGPSSSFSLANTVRNLVARCNSTSAGRSCLRQSRSSRPSDTLDPQAAVSAVSSVSSKSPGLPRPDQTILPKSESNTPVSDSGRHKRPRRDNDILTDGTSNEAEIYETIGAFLPSRSVADALVAAYFEHIHMIFPLFYRSIFQHRYEETWTRKDSILHDDEETGWLCCLSLVFAFGAQALEKHDPVEAAALQKKYLRFVRSYFRRLVSTTSLVDVQALLLLQLYDHNVGKRNSSWLLIGTAARMAISMGMHREGTYAELDPIERNTRRLVWWMLYIFEKILCNYLGRPSAIDDAEVSTRIPDESNLGDKHLPPNVIEKSIEAARLSYSIRRRAYFVDGSPEERTPPIPLVRKLLQELEDWYKTIPDHLQVGAKSIPSHRRGALLLHTYYFYIRSLVTRNFLVQKAEYNISLLEGKSPQVTADHKDILALGEDCIDSAARSLKSLNMLADLKLLNGVSWLDVFYVFHAVLIVCADFLGRPKDQKDTPEDIDRKTSVRTILASTRVIKLAPTYNILSQFAFQFAYITGATEAPYTSFQAAGEREILSPVPPMTPFVGPFTGHGLLKTLVETSEEPNDWYQNESANVLWDWFNLASTGEALDVDSFTEAFPPNPQDGGGFGASTIEDWAARPPPGGMRTV